MIRLAYYRRRCGEDFWEFASQMTVTAEPPIIKALLVRTLAKKTWFQPEASANLHGVALPEGSATPE